jgi:hypothetical protein
MFMKVTIAQKKIIRYFFMNLCKKRRSGRLSAVQLLPKNSLTGCRGSISFCDQILLSAQRFGGGTLA